MIYKLHAAISNGDGLAQLDIQDNGFIDSISFILDPDMNNNNDRITAECSFMSSNTFSTNDVRGSIGMVASQVGLATTGMAQNAVNVFFGQMGIKISAGERIFLHCKTVGTVSGDVTVYLYVNDGKDSRPPSRRR